MLLPAMMATPSCDIILACEHKNSIDCVDFMFTYIGQQEMAMLLGSPGKNGNAARRNESRRYHERDAKLGDARLALGDAVALLLPLVVPVGQGPADKDADERAHGQGNVVERRRADGHAVDVAPQGGKRRDDEVHHAVVEGLVAGQGLDDGLRGEHDPGPRQRRP